jgi:hypothetical protein
MPISTTRPPTDAERKMLEGARGRTSRWTNDLAGVGCLTALVLLLGTLLTRFTGILQGQEWWYTLLGLLIGIAVTSYMRRQLAPHRTAASRDLEMPVTETIYEVSRAVCVTEYGDLGSNYYLELADGGGVLFLSGQYLYEDEQEGRFPSSRIRTVRSGTGHTLLDFEPLGEYVAPETTLPAFTKEQYRAGGVPDDGDVLAVPFETLLR